MNQQGVEALAAAVIERAYIDYLRGRLSWYTFKYKDESKAAAYRYEKNIRRKMIAHRVAGKAQERHGYNSRWAEMDDDYLRDICSHEMELEAKIGRAEARKAREFFGSDRFDLFSNRLDGSTLVPRAEELLEEWLSGMTEEKDLLPKEYDYTLQQKRKLISDKAVEKRRQRGK